MPPRMPPSAHRIPTIKFLNSNSRIPKSLDLTLPVKNEDPYVLLLKLNIIRHYAELEFGQGEEKKRPSINYYD